VANLEERTRALTEAETRLRQRITEVKARHTQFRQRIAEFDEEIIELEAQAAQLQRDKADLAALSPASDNAPPRAQEPAVRETPRRPQDAPPAGISTGFAIATMVTISTALNTIGAFTHHLLASLAALTVSCVAFGAAVAPRIRRRIRQGRPRIDLMAASSLILPPPASGGRRGSQPPEAP
jgi:cation transport ATPase